MESALFFYELLPEGVFNTTSVSTNKTNEFDIGAGRYYYCTVKRDLFFGYMYYKLSDNADTAIMIAEPEKAILDFLYLKTWYNSYKELSELRFIGIVLTKDIDKEKLYKYLEKYNNKALEKRIDLLYKIHL